MDKLQAMAETLAANTQPWLGKPTVPPIAWAQNGEIVVVILADGRKVSANVQAINALVFKPYVKIENPAKAWTPDDKVAQPVAKPPAQIASKPASKPAAKQPTTKKK